MIIRQEKLQLGIFAIYYRTINSVQHIETGALLIISNYLLGVIWGNDLTIYLFDSHIKDENGNLSSSGTVVFLNFDTLHSLENYVKSLYYNTFQLTLYF